MEPIFAVSDVVWQALIAAVLAVVIAWLQIWAKLASDRQAREVAAKVEKVATRSEEIAEDVSKKAEEVAQKADEVAQKADKVAQTLAAATEKTDAKLEAVVETQVTLVKTTDTIHKLTNSGMGIQLRAHAVTCRVLATQSRDTNHPDAIKHAEAADIAEKKSDEHDKREAAMLDGNGSALH